MKAIILALVTMTSCTTAKKVPHEDSLDLSSFNMEIWIRLEPKDGWIQINHQTDINGTVKCILKAD